MNDELSPDIEALLSESDNLPRTSLPSLDDIPDSTPIEEKPSIETANNPLTIQHFKKIEKFFNDTENPIFSDPTYYKTALSGEGEAAQRLHAMLTKYLTCKDQKDKTVFRQQIVPIYWEFVRTLSPKMSSVSLPLNKKMLVRYGIVLPSLFTPESKTTFSKAIIENNTGEPIYYIDEWFKEIASGRISLSATDEARPKHVAKAGSTGADDSARLLQLQSKNNGKLQNAENMLLAKESERMMLEAELNSRVGQFCDHPDLPGHNHKAPLSESQKKLATEITDRLKSLLRVDKEIISYSSELEDAKEIAESLEIKLQNIGTNTEVNASDLFSEFDTIRQMAKMTVGRLGNHFPIFSREFYHCLPNGTGFRENIINIFSWIESLDPSVFCRVHKNVQHRIVPYVILVPTYGDNGFCWEPFDRYNRVSSRGRIVIPMYPRNLQISIIIAVADLRWQVAKEKASYYWMEEGLTGQYYQWFSSKKLKGDVKDYFINDYVLWMTKESEGVQRLEKEVRGIFWRHIPFSQETKEKLKTRSLVYQELYQRDINRSMSDGY